MKRKINIKTDEGEIEIEVKATLKAMQIYRAEFGSDLSKDLAAVNAALNPDPFLDAMKRAGISPADASGEELTQKILENLDYSAIREDEEIPDLETQTKALQIVWAMAKAADPEFTAFGNWTDNLDFQPVRSITDCVLEIWKAAGKATVELKN